MKRIMTLLLLPLALQVSAQKVWTMQECIDYAVEHNIDVQQRQLEQQSAEYQWKIDKYSWLPSVSANASQNFGFGQSPSYTGVYVQDNSSSSSFGINMSMPFFEGLNKYYNEKSSKLNLQASLMDLEAVRYDLKLTVMAYYMQVVYNKELKNVAERQLQLSENQYEKTKELAAVGKIAEKDVFESAAQVAADQSSLTEASNNLMLSILDLAQLLDLDDVESFDVVSPEAFAAEGLSVVNTPENVYESAIQSYPAIESARLRLQKSYFDLKSSKSAWYPSLNFFAGYSNGYYRYFNDSYENQSLSEQFKQNGRTQLGLSLNIPIFNSMRTKFNVKITELSIKNQELVIDNESKKLKKEIQQSYYNALAAEQKYAAAENSYKASEQAYEFSNAGFEAGKATLLELNESKTRLFKAESTMLQARYEYTYRLKVLEFYANY